MQFIADESQLIWQFEIAWFSGSNPLGGGATVWPA
jgi:hypothetical protein